MAFRDDFINGYLMTPSGPRQRTFAQWSLENTVDSGLRANQQQLRTLGEGIRSAFNAGIERLADSQAQSARLLQKELQYQADNIIDSIERGSADVVAAVQNACDYLGGQLCEVRWAIERQTQVAQQILQVLLTSLDVTSRQYYEQGVKCYETTENEFAKERFNRALDANRTNYFAYQYLGFIAVNADDSKEAIKNFDLARKFAENNYYRALAHSHLARSLGAIGEVPRASENATAAAQAAPDHARFWYESAVYYVRLSKADDAIASLRRAISTDWNYWSICITDSNLDPIRPKVNSLLDTMREEQRVIARNCLDRFRETLSQLRTIAITTEVSTFISKAEQCESQYREGTVFSYRNAVPVAEAAHKEALDQSLKTLDQRMASNRSALTQFQTSQRNEISKARGEANTLEYQARSKADSYKGSFGCLQFIGIAVSGILGFVWLNQRDMQPLGVLSLIVAGFLVFMHPIRKLVTATMPASDLRSQAEEKKRQAESFATATELKISGETKRREDELAQFKLQKENCQKRLGQMFPSNAAKAGR
jgi:tetratricopeptide (TPR) repeat protein